MLLFVNVPYRMVEKNMERAVGLSIGLEVYLDNHLIEEIDMGQVKELSAKLRDHKIPCTVHAPFMDLSPGGYDRSIRKITRDKLKKSAEVANLFEARACVCHPGYDKWRFDGNEQLWLDGSIETWEEVLGAADKDLPIVVENIFEETPATFSALFDYFKEKNLWFCFDSGHFNLFSKVSLDDWLAPLKKRIREMHLHDNHGAFDDHLPIGSGSFPFRELKAFLRQTEMKEIIFTVEPHSEGTVVDSIKRLKEFLS
jgi:sugar phosphate isomerase/epimerase